MTRESLPTSKSGAVLLAGYPGDRLVIACERCGRRGEYSVDKLLERFGNIALSALRLTLARCDRAANMSDPCSAAFPELAAQLRSQLGPAPAKRPRPGVEELSGLPGGDQP